MNGRTGVPVRVRRVSSELRELRLRSGLGAEEVARSLGFSMSKLSRMENGQRGLYPDDVAALLGLYRVPAQRRDEILKIVRGASHPNWWQVQDGRVPGMWEDIIRFEKEAVAIHNYETMVIPGLLQTSEYAATIMEANGRELTPAEMEALVSARMSRQTLLHSANAPTFTFLIEQSVLERLVGSTGLMYRQLRQLISAASWENVTVRVLPSSLGAHSGLEGPFMLLEFRSHEDLVYLENRGSTAFLEETEHVAEARGVLQGLCDAALSQEDSIQLIARIADELG
ncbi:transcriptional regulator [Saccharopolyspora subtropica]|uniref:Transcriptional regulator n=1 Tax=Saccharopolyspora thermophila TaxID=89367 RepID=A0A917KCU1_9PSEU|nr:helix-turn-helix transcriptional regulator [Saccharopolyspora subtropica]GGJ06351.1 transcriptional regulator [Saccharopolyspora subtropica]